MFQVLDEHNDIQQALARPAKDDFNDTDLEEELAELMKNDSSVPPPDEGGMNTSDLDKKLENMSLNLPDVPESSPDTSVEQVREANESGI